MPIDKRGLLCAAAALIVPWRVATAHGEKKHDAAPVKKEQQDWGIAGDARAVRRTVDVRMLDTMRFVPDRIDVLLNETVRFKVRNTGQVMHEFVIGTRAENERHAALMLKFPDMEHDEPYMAHVAPGKKGELVWQFTKAGEFHYACLVPGHMEAGMMRVVSVEE